MTFKEMVEADVSDVFLNNSEFAEEHNVIYNGVTYQKIPVVLTKIKQSKSPVIPTPGFEGIHIVSAVAHISQTDLGGVFPEKGQIIKISDGEAVGRPFYKKYRIVTSDVEMGMICLELEAFDE